MKNLLPFIIPVIVLISACGKKSDTPAPNTVTINGGTYPTVTIGSLVWTTQNYNGSGGGQIKATGSAAASTGDYYNSIAGITLPAGWRLPSAADFNTLMGNYSGGTDIYGNDLVNLAYSNYYRSVDGWVGGTGTNGTGFNAYPAGEIAEDDDDGPPKDISEDLDVQASFLTSTPYASSPPDTFVFLIRSASETVNGFVAFAYLDRVNVSGNKYYCSLRFVKDK